MAKYDDVTWSNKPDNPNNLISRTIELHSKKKRMFIPESAAPEGMPISEIDYDNDTKGRGVVFDGNKPVNLIFVSLFRNKRLAPMRFREVKGKARPFMYVPVFIEGSPDLFKLAVNGKGMVNELNATIDAFYEKIVNPFLKQNPNGPKEIFNFSIPIILNRRVVCGESHIYAPDLNFGGSFEDYFIGDEDAATVEHYLQEEALPFLKAQEDARIEDARRKFGNANSATPPPSQTVGGQVESGVPF